MDADGTNVLQLTSNAVFDSAPALSTDGTQIVFERARGTAAPAGDRRLRHERRRHGRATADRPPGLDEGPIFSPDGTKIVFSSARDGQQELLGMNADGSDLRRLTDNPARDESPDWQPLPFDMPATSRCGDVASPRPASSVATRGAVPRRRDPGATLGRPGRRRRPPGRLHGYASTTAPHPYDLTVVQCRKDRAPCARDVAFL